MDALQIDITLPRRDYLIQLDLRVGRETVALVGPSGAGKTSVLRAVAGLERPSLGRIVLDGRVVWDESGVNVAVEDRRVGFVFQEYALFPHMTVAQNVAFAGTTVDVDGLLERFRIGHLARERPAGLSGGERQRVALARALASDPAVLLLDEPLAALDAHTRATVRHELTGLLAQLDIPVVMVTHDFNDAAVLADRIGVIRDGHITQMGAPSELLAAPADAFVASFTGANVLAGIAQAGEGGLSEVTLEGGQVVYSTDELAGPVEVVVHPWEIAIARTRSAESTMNHITAPVMSVVRVGNRARVQVGPLVGEITGASVDALGLRDGDVVVASFKAAATRLVPGTGAA